MGTCASVRNEPEMWKQWGPLLLTLNFTKSDFRRLAGIFQKMDKDGSGSIGLKELLHFLGMEESDFMQRAFTIFDEDKSGEVDFAEFVLCSWNYCTETKSSFLMFTFELYDIDKSGCISKDEIKLLLNDVFGPDSNKYFRSEMAKVIAAVDAMDSSKSGLSFQDFSKLTKSYPALLSACYELHQTIQNKILGSRFWEKLSTKPIVDKGKEYQLGDFKEKQLHKQFLTTHHHHVHSNKTHSAHDNIVNHADNSNIRSSNHNNIETPNKGMHSQPSNAWSHSSPAQPQHADVSDFRSSERMSMRHSASSQSHADNAQATGRYEKSFRSYAQVSQNHNQSYASPSPVESKIMLFEAEQPMYKEQFFSPQPQPNKQQLTPVPTSSARKSRPEVHDINVANSSNNNNSSTSFENYHTPKTSSLSPARDRNSARQLASNANNVQAITFSGREKVESEDSFGWNRGRKGPPTSAHSHAAKPNEKLVIEEFD